MKANRISLLLLFPWWVLLLDMICIWSDPDRENKTVFRFSTLYNLSCRNWKYFTWFSYFPSTTTFVCLFVLYWWGIFFINIVLFRHWGTKCVSGDLKKSTENATFWIFPWIFILVWGRAYNWGWWQMLSFPSSYQLCIFQALYWIVFTVCSFFFTVICR